MLMLRRKRKHELKYLKIQANRTMFKVVKKHVIVISILLFILGILWFPLVKQDWLHELGHVLAAFVTGGYGWIESATMARAESFFQTFVYLGGALFCFVFGAGLMLLTMHKGVPWVGAFFWGKAHFEIFYFIGSWDQIDARISTGLWLLLVIPPLLLTWGFLLVFAERYRQNYKKHVKIEHRNVV